MYRYEIRNYKDYRFDAYRIYDNKIQDYIKNNNHSIVFTKQEASCWLNNNCIETKDFMWR